MRSTMDAGGRIVLPKEVRERLRLAPGQQFDIHIGPALEIVVEPVEVSVRLQTSDLGLPVLVADEDVAPVSDADVRRWREELADEREGDLA
jgi:AbrB family looped-hinge helix DNA binding protein